MSWLLYFACAGPPVAPGAVAPGAVAPGAVAPAPEVSTLGDRYRLTWSTDVSPIPFNALFAVRTVLRDRSGAPIPDGSVVVDASMPQHGHGMPTRPIARPGVCSPKLEPGAAASSTLDCTHPDGVYVSEGMKFHMAGEWVLHFVVSGPLGPDTADAHYTL